MFEFSDAKFYILMHLWWENWLIERVVL